MNPLSEKISLDFRSDEPLYLQIAQQIETLMTSGTLKLGDQLPTVRELAMELRINFNTVARAYRILDESRLISTQRGRGTYIWEAPNEEAIRQFKMKNLEELTRNYQEEVIRLGYTVADALEELKRIQTSGPQADPEEPTIHSKL